MARTKKSDRKLSYKTINLFNTWNNCFYGLKYRFLTGHSCHSIHHEIFITMAGTQKCSWEIILRILDTERAVIILFAAGNAAGELFYGFLTLKEPSWFCLRPEMQPGNYFTGPNRGFYKVLCSFFYGCPLIAASDHIYGRFPREGEGYWLLKKIIQIPMTRPQLSVIYCGSHGQTLWIIC